MADHSSLADSELHENKGVASATNNSVATANAGATVWQKITEDNIDATDIFNINKVYLQVHIQDISTADTVYLYLPFAGTLTRVGTVLNAAISGADATITVRDNGGNSAGTITVAQSGSAAGDIDTLVPASNNTFTAGQKISISTDGASTGTARLDITLSFTVTG